MRVDVATMEGYDVATALRAPDVRTPLFFCIKNVLTKRLRTLVGARMGRCTPCGPETWVTFREELEKLVTGEGRQMELKALRHVGGHLLLAFSAIGGSHEVDLLERLSGDLRTLGYTPCDTALQSTLSTLDKLALWDQRLGKPNSKQKFWREK
jgi:hypothetical protein